MTREEAETIQVGDTVHVGALVATVEGVKHQHNEMFFETQYGDFNVSVCGKLDCVNEPESQQVLSREQVIEVLDKNFKEAGVRLTTRRYNQILTDLGFGLVGAK